METRILKVTPIMANEWLTKSETRNRPLKNDRVEYYADQMKRGMWRLIGQGISFDNKMNIIDGQHRLAAIVKSNTIQEFLIIYNVPYENFSVYDDMKIRGLSDVFSIEFKTKNSVNKSTIINRFLMFSKNQKFTGLSSINTKTPKTEILEEYKKRPELYDEITLLSMKCYHKYRLFTSSEVGYISAHLILNLKYDFKTVSTFFLQLHGIDGDEISTTKLLRERLISLSMERKKINTNFKIQLLAKCWNHWINGIDLKVLKIGDGEIVRFQ